MIKQTSLWKIWLSKAENDLSWTQASLKENIFYGACFAAQQTEFVKSKILKK